ncbi:multiheme c-type cytochrome [Paraliomyxa miuraensis]|uniref:multiheme c-type cytochrome n=1 Tax=Paraliomyxa miuraensis TaxID=376150 RepID=UPI0022511A72|nr:multiheme c-type cytochrome [Paraliomyxa miuraensis]MCX4246402.1 cytochrome c family protein [Paraliomyxa miuraensis]
MSRKHPPAHAWPLVLAVLAGCPSDPDPPPALDPNERLLDPATCEECHPTHYREWLGSMHAYAAEDPVFRAMNARGQRETNGELGDFCVRCHAPMAVELGLTTDGLNLDEVPQHLRGVTCFFCHTTESVGGAHNNPLQLSGQRTMLGAIHDPVDNDAHASAYSPLLDSATMESADMCGSCHDVVTPNGVHLERTFVEWQGSFFSDVDPLSGGPAIYGQRCGTCHMGRAIEGPIADAPGVRADRLYHPHAMQAVDVALHDWPDAELGPELRAEQLELIEFQRKSALCASICVNPRDDGGSDLDIYLHNEFSAHSWPSGSAQDRRAWLELRAFAGDTPALELGMLDDVQPLSTIADDPLLWQFRDWMRDAAGQEVHMFWDAEQLESNLLPASEILSPLGDASTWRARRYEVPGTAVDRVTTRLRLRPMGLDTLDDLVASGDLDPAFRDQITTFDVTPTVLEWTPDTATEFEGYGQCVSSSSSCGAPLIGAAPPS